MNFNNIINKHILYDGDHSFAWKSIPTHFCHVFVVTISW
jgi:hypothetical protein